MEKNKKGVDIRQEMTSDRLMSLEKSFIQMEHFKRYASVRRFCYGQVLDFACGTGYGSFIISAADDIEKVLGVDFDAEAIDLANKEFKKEKIEFICSSAEKVNKKFDTLVCLETIEHIKDETTVPKLVERCKIDNIIISFPDKKTTHYNKHHCHDFVRQDIINLFPNHVVYHQIKSFDSLIVLLIRLPAKAPYYLFKNVRDLE